MTQKIYSSSESYRRVNNIPMVFQRAESIFISVDFQPDCFHAESYRIDSRLCRRIAYLVVFCDTRNSISKHTTPNETCCIAPCVGRHKCRNIAR